MLPCAERMTLDYRFEFGSNWDERLRGGNLDSCQLLVHGHATRPYILYLRLQSIACLAGMWICHTNIKKIRENTVYQLNVLYFPFPYSTNCLNSAENHNS